MEQFSWKKLIQLEKNVHGKKWNSFRFFFAVKSQYIDQMSKIRSFERSDIHLSCMLKTIITFIAKWKFRYKLLCTWCFDFWKKHQSPAKRTPNYGKILVEMICKKIIKWKRKKNWNQTAFMPCVRLWFAINFFSSCFYILLCLLAITPLWLYCYRDYRNGSFWSWIKCRNKRTKSTTFIFATTKKKKCFKAMLIAEHTLIMLWRKPRASERNKHVKYIYSISDMMRWAKPYAISAHIFN